MTNEVEASLPAQRDQPRTIWSWALFDWGNSAFTTLVVTFVYSTWFTKVMAPNEITGTSWWSLAVAISAILIAVFSPILGTAADRTRTRKRWLAVATLTCVAMTTGLAFIQPGGARNAMIALILFVIANVAFELAGVMYNAFLPVIASPSRIGRVSGYGWALGYAGGLVCMAIALVGFVSPEVPWFGVSKDAGWNIRVTNLLVAGWFLAFSLPLFINLREPSRSMLPAPGSTVLGDLRRTFGDLKRYRHVVRFLVARLIYNDGLVTIFAFGGIYAAGTFGMSLSEVIVFGVVLNLASGLGALLFGFVDDHIGGKRTVLLTLVMLAIATGVAVWAPTREWFWLAGVMIGIFVGPNQAASRSLMGRFVPARHQAEFFGFFALSGKATAFMGPLLLGGATKAFGSQRAGVATVLGFFVVGGLLLLLVDESAGIQAASNDSESRVAQ